jgi:poly(beta-D-mannuronate) lyase
MITPALSLRRALRVSLGAVQLLAALCGGAVVARAATHTLDSVAALQAGLDAAKPGDAFILKDGVYKTTEALTVRCVGTRDQPITISAENVGGVEISGTHGFDVVKPATFIVIRGFNFTHAAGTNTIRDGATHVRFTRNTFHCSGPGAELDVAGDDAEVDRNEFRDKAAVGNMVSVTGRGSEVAQRLWLHHNYFHDYANARANGAETIRLGRSFYSMSRGDALVEYNLFVRCVGENELITNKSGGNTYRYNTFLESPRCQLTLRHGNDCVVYGNYFRGTDGLRIFGDRHRIFSNYFEGNTLGINLGNGGGEVADGAKLTAHDRPDDCVIVFNTLIDNKVQYAMNARANGMGATRTTFASNLIVGGDTTVKIDGPYPGATWGNNLLWQVANVGALPEGTYTVADPKLTADAHGVLHINAGSAAIDSASDAYTFVTVDQDGQPREGKKSAGADELSSAPIMARVLTPADVGPLSP